MRTSAVCAVLALLVLSVAAADFMPPPNTAAAYVNQTHYLYQNSMKALHVSQDKNPAAGFKLMVTMIANISFLDIGWDFIQVAPSPWLLLQSEPDAYYLSGYLEGYITFTRISQVIIANNFSANTAAPVAKWVQDHIDYINASSTNVAADAGPDAILFWGSIRNQLKLMEGLTDGYAVANRESGSRLPDLTFFDIFLLNFGNDLGDVEGAVSANPQARSLRKLRLEQHCSALVKVTQEDIYFSHTTWGSYNTMVRQYKVYAMSTTVSMSAVAGTIASGDDWYITSNNLAVQETTNEFYNVTLFDLIKPNSVSEFMRTMAANFLSKTGQEWVGYFAYNHSGTYCNQYMVLDYKLYTPGQMGQQLADNLLWVTEEIPGLVLYEDVTAFLRNFSFWSSYNLPYFKQIFNISGFKLLEDQYGDIFSYSKYSRSIIFARNESDVVDLATMQKIMRYNNWKGDPMSKIQPNCSYCLPVNNPWQAISGRGDLVPANAILPTEAAVSSLLDLGPSGAIDAKIASYAMLNNGYQGRVVCGPTTDEQPPFSWDQFPGQIPGGSPVVYNFSWTNFNVVDLYPAVAAQSSSGNTKEIIIGVCVGVPLAIIIVAVVFKWRKKESAYEGVQYEPMK